MNYAIKLGAAALLSVALAGCVVPINREAASKADFGPRPTEEQAMTKIKAFLQDTLIDPDSLKLRCSGVRKGWARDYSYQKPLFGWTVLCGVNAKNRFGGYTGEGQFLFFFHDDRMAHIEAATVQELRNVTGVLD